MRLKALSRIKFANKTIAVLLLAAIVLIVALAAYQPLSFLNLAGLLLVLAGTLCAAVLSYSFNEVLLAFKQSLRGSEASGSETLKKEVMNDANVILHFAQLWFRSQNSLIDRDLSKLEKPFLKQGLQMVRDRQSSDEILSLMNWQISQVNSKQNERIAVFRSMANFAPAFGMAGSVLGLLNMLQMLDQGNIVGAPAAMVVAMVSTFYGLLMANLVFKPLATKLDKARRAEVQHLTFLAEGILLIQEKRTPAVIRNTLMTYIESMQGETKEARLDSPKDSSPKKSFLVKFGLQGS
jgi:chemotaxis protein MotA